MAVQLINQRVVVDTGITAEPVEVATHGKTPADRPIDNQTIHDEAVGGAYLSIAIGQTYAQHGLSGDGDALMNCQYVASRTLTKETCLMVAVSVTWTPCAVVTTGDVTQSSEQAWDDGAGCSS